MSQPKPSGWQWISIQQIQILNPRTRNKIKFNEIVESIATVGLKKPIVVAPRTDAEGQVYYVTACGQGRVEAFQKLGQTRIPAICIDADDKTLLLFSLAENMARRQRSALEQFREIEYMKDHGYTLREIAAKTGLGAKYLSQVLRLLKQGEQRLVQAVLRRQMPIKIAMTISSENDQELQQALADAYEEGSLKGDKLARVRQIIDKRRKRGKALRTGGRRKADGTVTSRDLVQIYKDETLKHRAAVKKAELCERQLLFVVSALKTLFQDDDFLARLRAEGLDDLPECLMQRVRREESAA